MAIKSKDLIAQAKERNAATLANALKSGDEGLMSQALADFFGDVHDAVLQAAQSELNLRNGDNVTMAARGYHVLTSAEMSYYNKMSDMIREDPQAALTNWNEPMPNTIIDGVIGTIRKSHPLLDKLNFRNVAYMTKYVLTKKPTGLAAWGPITSKVKDEITGALETLDMTICKLSAFMVISRDIIDLGPQWIDTFIRETLAEVIAMALETAVITGNGKDQPIGMIMDITSNSSGVYSAMATTPLTELTPAAMGLLVAKLAKDPVNPTQARAINPGDLLMIVNPFDYWEKIFAATSMRLPDGSYVHDVLPIPADLEQSAALEKGKAVLGIPSRYFIGLGQSNKQGTITTDDSVHFLEDERVFKAVLRGNARPMDQYSFLYLDISKLKTTLPIITKQEGVVADAASVMSLPPQHPETHSEEEAGEPAKSGKK